MSSPFDSLPDSLFLIDKPTGWTSFDVVNKLRRVLNIKKIGHSGTLDPFATGLLLLATGKKTKTLNDLQGLDKIYTGVIKLGATTPSFDPESEETGIADPSHITLAQIESAINNHLTGQILQQPPMFSAIKINGKKLYELARKGKTIDVPKREVTIFYFTVTKYQSPFISFEVKSSKGTYIRSLAHDLGQLLGVGGYLTELRRTAIGDFSIQDALTLEEVIAITLEQQTMNDVKKT